MSGYWEIATSYLPEGVSAYLPYDMQAQVGSPAPMNIYDNMDSALVATPTNIVNAYDQVIYLYSIAVRRAISDGNATAKADMTAKMEMMQKYKDSLSVSKLCDWTGIGCSKAGMSELLDTAVLEIQNSNLSTYDKDKLISVLKTSKKAVFWRSALVYGIAGVAILGTGFIGYRYFKVRS